MRTYVLVVILFCSITSISQNCNYTLSGTVSDLHDGSLLFGATIIVVEAEQVVETNVDGEFVIADLCNDTYTVRVSHVDCITKDFTVKIAGNTTRILRLEHHLEQLNEITVDGKAFGDSSKTMLESTVSKEELEQYTTGSLGDALNSLSGVSSLNTGNTVVKPMINGLHSSRVIIVNNGVRLEDQEWGAEHAPNIDINSVGNLTVIKGAGALQYGGDAIGGVIVADGLKAPVIDSLYGKTLMSLGSNGRGGVLSSHLTKSYASGWYGTVQGTIKRFGDFEAPDYILSNTGVRGGSVALQAGLNRFNYGIEAYYSYFTNEIGILRASHLGGALDQVRAIESDVPLYIEDFTYDIDPPKQDVTHNLARIKGFKRFDKLGKLSLQYDFQKNDRLEYDVRRGDDKYKPSVDLELKTHTLMLDLDTKILDELNFKAGLLGRYQNNFADPSTGVRRLIPDYDKYDLGVYAITDYRFNDNFLVELGVRFDHTYMDVWKFYRTSFWEDRAYDEQFPEYVVEEYNNQILTNPQLTFNNPSATIGANYYFENDLELFLNYSIASRAPNPSELFSEGLHHSASRIELGDLSFDSEIGHKILLTLQQSKEDYSFSVTTYLNKISDFILIEPTGIQQTVRGNFQVWEYRQTDAQLYGLDIDFTYYFARNFHFNSQFSWVKGYEVRNDEPLIHMPPASTTNEVVYQNLKLSNLRIALQSVYVTEQKEYPDNNFEVFIPETGTTEIVNVSTPPDAYHLLNFNSSIDVKVAENSMLNVGISISNVLNTSYRNYLNRQRYYADDLGRNILLNLKFNY